MKLSDLRDRLAHRPGSPAHDGDFGIGDKVARRPGTRLINADGSFNVVRRGRSVFAPYQNLVEMRWTRFLLLTVAIYVVCNLLFALGFLAIGTDQLANVPQSETLLRRYLLCFYFSVQTFTTVGYGQLAPIGIGANALAALLSLFGWIALALVTGLVFARFSRPSRMIVFSERAIISRLRSGKRSLQFRIANLRDTNLINLNARVVLTWLEEEAGELRRHFRPLTLERDHVPLFPLNWTIVHPIDEDSPIYGWNKDDYCRRHSELLIMIEGYDQTFAQSVHIKNSYLHRELEWNRRFAPMYRERENGTELDLEKINDVLEEE